jgi:acyl carrier protein
MAQKEKIIEVIYAVIDEINETLPEDGKLKASPETILFGKNGSLDSLGIVSLITGIEQKIEEELGATINLANEKAMFSKDSPFETIGKLTNYIYLVLQKEIND